MLNPGQIVTVVAAIDERVVRLERRIEKLQGEITNLEASKDELNQMLPPPLITATVKEI